MYLQLAISIKLGTMGFRIGSATLTGEEKPEQPRPSELMGTLLEPLLSECSLKNTIHLILHFKKKINNIQGHGRSRTN